MIEPRPYRDRREAGQILARHARDRVDRARAVVLALPRGGVPVGFEVARELDAPLDVFLVRKVGVPDQPELAMGAIASGGFQILNQPLIEQLGVSPRDVAQVIGRESAELARREKLYRSVRPVANVRGGTVILVDDGLATGYTMRAAIEANRQRGAEKLVVAVPVGADSTCEEIAREVDVLVCPLQPQSFYAVGQWYQHFGETTDDEVRECLAAAARNEQLAHAHRGGHAGYG